MYSMGRLKKTQRRSSKDKFSAGVSGVSEVASGLHAGPRAVRAGRLMSRQLRLEFSEAIHHVTSRGNERGNIYRDARDRRRFPEILEEVVVLRRQARKALALLAYEECGLTISPPFSPPHHPRILRFKVQVRHRKAVPSNTFFPSS
jgi:hypothetical protein